MAPPLSARTVSGFTSLQEIGGDLRYGLRMLRRTPGLTAIAVLSLAIGVGANSAIFSVIDSIVLRSLPVRDPEGLTIVQALTRQGNRTSLPTAIMTGSVSTTRSSPGWLPLSLAS